MERFLIHLGTIVTNGYCGTAVFSTWSRWANDPPHYCFITGVLGRSISPWGYKTFWGVLPQIGRWNSLASNSSHVCSGRALGGWRSSGTAAFIIINHVNVNSWDVLWSASWRWRTTQTRLLKFKLISLKTAPCFWASPWNNTALKGECDSARNPPPHHHPSSTTENVKHAERFLHK